MSRWRPERSLTAFTEIKIAALDVPWLVSDEKVTRYALMLERLPPVVVFDIGGDPVVADGYHRINAARRLEHPTIKAQVWRGTWEDALAFAAHTLAVERGLAIEVALGMIRRHMGGGAMPRTVRRRLRSRPMAALLPTARG
jgi:hypothetical protein